MNGHRVPPSGILITRRLVPCPCPRGQHTVAVRAAPDGYRARLADLDQPWSAVAWGDVETAIGDAIDTHLEAEE